MRGVPAHPYVISRGAAIREVLHSPAIFRAGGGYEPCSMLAIPDALRVSLIRKKDLLTLPDEAPASHTLRMV